MNHSPEVVDVAADSDAEILMNPPEESPNRFGEPILEEFHQRFLRRIVDTILGSVSFL